MTIIFVAGLSRVGKTQLCEEAVKRDPRLIHVRASLLLKLEGCSLDLADEAQVNANQDTLLQIIGRLRPSWTRPVLFDGHALIETAKGPVLVRQSVFDHLTPATFVMVCMAPNILAARRGQEPAGNNLVVLARMQEAEETHAKHQAKRIGIPFVILESGDVEGLLHAANDAETRAKR